MWLSALYFHDILLIMLISQAFPLGLSLFLSFLRRSSASGQTVRPGIGLLEDGIKSLSYSSPKYAYWIRRWAFRWWYHHYASLPSAHIASVVTHQWSLGLTSLISLGFRCCAPTILMAFNISRIMPLYIEMPPHTIRLYILRNEYELHQHFLNRHADSSTLGHTLRGDRWVRDYLRTNARQCLPFLIIYFNVFIAVWAKSCQARLFAAIVTTWMTDRLKGDDG